jgi:hypothetical protein
MRMGDIERFAYLWQLPGWRLVELLQPHPRSPRYLVANTTRPDLTPIPHIPHDLRAAIVARMLDASVPTISLTQSLADHEREVIRRQGLTHMIYSGLDGLVSRWERLAQHIVTSKTYTEDDFVSFMFDRFHLHGVVAQLGSQLRSESRHRIAEADAIAEQNLTTTRVCIIESQEVRDTVLEPDEHWYFFRAPARVEDPRGWRSLEAWGAA